MTAPLQTWLGASLLGIAAIGWLVLWVRSKLSSGTIVPVIEQPTVMSAPQDAAEAMLEDVAKLDPVLACLSAMHLVVRLQTILHNAGHVELAQELDKLYPALRWSSHSEAEQQ